MTDETFKPVDLSPELKREQRIKDAEYMKSLDKKWKLTRYDGEDLTIELSKRLLQYKSLSFFISFEHRIHQTLIDFIPWLELKQVIVSGKKNKVYTVDYLNPVAKEKKSGKNIYVNQQGIFYLKGELVNGEKESKE